MQARRRGASLVFLCQHRSSHAARFPGEQTKLGQGPCTSPMRFLILTQYYPPEIGAPQVRLAAMARELVRAGHDVEVVTAMPNHLVGRIFPAYAGKFYVLDRWDDVPVHRTWMYAA